MPNLLLALLPILLVLVLLFAFKQTAVRAGLCAYVLTVLIALFRPSFHVSGSGLVTATIQGALTAAIVSYVLLFGILLFHLMNEMGVIQSIADFVAQSTDNPVEQVLILVIAFSPLVESASGFGIAIIVVAPILIALGFDRFQATLLSMVGLSAVPWGALATGTVIGAQLTGMPLSKMGVGTALLLLPTFFYLATLAIWIAGGWRSVRKKGLEIVVMAGTLSGCIWLFNRYVSVELSGVLAAMVTLALALLFVRRKQAALTAPAEVAVTAFAERAGAQKAKVTNGRSIGKSISPYLFLTGVLLLTRFVPPLKAFLTHIAVLDFPKYKFYMPLFYSPGFSLLLACLFTLWVFKIDRTVFLRSIHATWIQWVPVTVSTTAFVAMSDIMTASGMTNLLAQTAAAAFGASFLFVSPLIGGLGGFLTGSNTGSNAMFIHLQTQVAQQLGMSTDLVAYGQNASASHMTITSPSRVLLAVTVSQIPEEENRLLRRISLIAIGALLLVMISMWVMKISL